MTDITSASKLLFFKAEQYDYEGTHGFDTSTCPRPHFCMGLVLAGKGIFHDCTTGEDVAVARGDIIFVPMGSRYVSSWQGDPHISYISMHFIFDSPGLFTPQKHFQLQRARLRDADAAEADFRFMLQRYGEDGAAKLAVLSKFFAVLSELLPSLARGQGRDVDVRIGAAVDYIERHYTETLTVDLLAKVSNMSVSRFFPIFRAAMGLTPVEYIQHYRVNRAIVLLMSHEKLSIEEISDKAGFESSAYFRRVFKKLTGKSPREYRATAMEI